MRTSGRRWCSIVRASRALHIVLIYGTVTFAFTFTFYTEVTALLRLEKLLQNSKWKFSVLFRVKKIQKKDTKALAHMVSVRQMKFFTDTSATSSFSSFATIETNSTHSLGSVTYYVCMFSFPEEWNIAHPLHCFTALNFISLAAHKQCKAYK